MRILLVSKFLRHVGGVETYLHWLGSTLHQRGHEVTYLGMDAPANGQPVAIQGQRVVASPSRDFHATGLHRWRSASSSVYSLEVGRIMREVLREERPHVVHFHGTCYQLTPSVFWELSRNKTPGLLTAHEYKLICANQRFWDDSRSAECYKCIGLSSLAKSQTIIRSRCVKGSTAASLLAAAEQPIAQHFVSRANILIHAPSRFLKSQLLADGWSPKRLIYADLPWPRAEAAKTSQGSRRYVVYMGRLSVEKGVDRLIAVWPSVRAQAPHLSLRIAGDGAERSSLVAQARRLGVEVEFTGAYTPSHLDAILSDALMTVHPSLWAENSPFTVRESLTRGVPAIVSNRGGLPEMVDRATGTVFEPADPESLSEVIAREAATPRAASSDLQAAVANRATTPDAHADWIESTYGALMAG